MPVEPKFPKQKRVTEDKTYCAQEMTPRLERNKNIQTASNRQYFKTHLNKSGMRQPPSGPNKLGRTVVLYRVGQK